MVEDGRYSSLPPMTPTRPAWPLCISLESGGINCFTRWRVLATDIANIENKGRMSSGKRRRVLRVWSGTLRIMTSGFVSSVDRDSVRAIKLSRYTSDLS
jgi:hypothetical protein